MRSDVYSPLKIVHHAARVKAIGTGEVRYPVHVQLVPTNVCNHRCRFCAYRAHGYSSAEQFNVKDTIPEARLLSLVDELAECGVQAVQLTGGGEPTIHPAFNRLCQRLYEQGLEVGLVTNGSRLSSTTHLESMLRMKWVRVSVDAGRAETYGATREVPPEIYGQVRNGIHRLSTARKGSEPVIGVGFVVTPYNWEEVYEAALNAKADGADNFRISAEFQNEGAAHFASMHTRAYSLCKQCEDLADKHFTVFNRFGERLQDLVDKAPEYPVCAQQYLTTYIGADMCVYRCCVYAYSERGYLCSVKDRTFAEAWSNPETQTRLRDCDPRACARCMYHGTNRLANYMLNPNPPHVNFV